jgi:hypothetical protein
LNARVDIGPVVLRLANVRCRWGRMTYWVGNTGEIFFKNKAIWCTRHQDSCILSTSYANKDFARTLLEVCHEIEKCNLQDQTT